MGYVKTRGSSLLETIFAVLRVDSTLSLQILLVILEEAVDPLLGHLVMLVFDRALFLYVFVETYVN